MQNMDRTRIIFIAIISLALVVVCGFVAVTFIGDRLDIDVDGAARSGLDSGWIDTCRQEWTPQHAQPQYTIGGLGDLRQILERNVPES